MVGRAFAQSNFTLYNLNNTPQSQYENPAFRSSARFGIAFPPFSGLSKFHILNSGFAIEDVLQTRSESDSLNLTIGNALAKMGDINYFDIDIRNEVFAFNYTGRKTSISVTANHVFNSSFAYPKALLELGYYGNGSPETIGQRQSFDQIGYNLTSYLEFGLGFNQKIGKKLVVGGRFKYLIGLANIQTEYSHFGLLTDEKTFDLTVDAEASINTSNSLAFFNSGQEFELDINELFSAFSGISNNGAAIDLGFTYDISKKIHLSGSLIDLGSIRWRNRVTNYTISPFEFEYKGIDLMQYLDDSVQVFNEIIDSLEQLSSIIETNSSYSSSLYTRFYIAGSYDVLDKLNLGVTWYNSFRTKRYRTGLNLSANLKLRHWIAATANYSFYNYGNSNLGLGLNLRLGTIQLYGMTNSFLALLKPEATRRLDFNFGMSFQIGKTPEYKKSAEDE